MRTIRTLMLIVIVCGLGVRPAQASWLGFYEYLEALSGPGPFHGVGVELPIYCNDEGLSIRCFWSPGTDPSQPRQESSAAQMPPPTERRIEIAGHIAGLRSTDAGELDYPDGRPQINVLMYGGSATMWFRGARPGELRSSGQGFKRIQAGAVARVSVLHFTGTSVTADDVMLRVGPILSFATGGSTRVIVSPQLQIGLGPFDREEFGALPGPPLNERVRLHVQVGFTRF